MKNFYDVPIPPELRVFTVDNQTTTSESREIEWLEQAAYGTEPPQPIDDGGCDPLFGRRMDSADMGEN